ncbi:hypothetical protein [Mycobacterium sp. ENV421]|uniref:hypothetical protein n=1 Tax=Mycobacterium sp. ENV421 TaxID=1213407 RepID=UPI001E45408B|nr:hypothetical protein [Mycobacterium sp. ENV421]
MIVIIGLVVLLIAVFVGFTGVLANAGAAHPLTENFSVLGYHVTGSTGTLFLFGIVVGLVAMLGLSVLLAGARRTAGRGRDARNQLARSQRETAVLNHERDERVERQPIATTTGPETNPQPAPTRRARTRLLSRFSRDTRSTETPHVAERR